MHRRRRAILCLGVPAMLLWACPRAQSSTTTAGDEHASPPAEPRAPSQNPGVPAPELTAPPPIVGGHFAASATFIGHCTQGRLGGCVTIELLPDGRFSLLLYDAAQAGTYRVEGRTVVLSTGERYESTDSFRSIGDLRFRPALVSPAIFRSGAGAELVCNPDWSATLTVEGDVHPGVFRMNAAQGALTFVATDGLTPSRWHFSTDDGFATLSDGFVYVVPQPSR